MLAKALNIRPEEESRVLLLLVHSFFIGIFVACYFTYVNGALLSLFDVDVLPYAYMASGLCGYLTALVFSRLQARVAYDRLLVGLLIFIFLMALLFRMLAFSPASATWLTFVMFVWAGPFVSLIGLQYWGMALKLFDLRQGKRLFGIIGSGDVVSSIIGYLSMPLVLQYIASIQLLWIGSASLLVGLLFQLVIIRKFSAQLVAVAPARKEKGTPEKGEVDQSIFKSRYFRLIASLAVISLLGQYLVDYNFMGVFKGTFSQEQLTQYIGVFFGVIKITELLTKTLVAGQLLNNYGIRLGLTLMPVLLLIFTGLALVTHPFIGNGFIFFLLIYMNKLFDKVVRRGMEEPSFKALYQPFDGPTKIAFQTRVEGAVKQLGVIGAGILLILLGLIPGFDVLKAHAVYILMGILVMWLVLSRKTYEEYRLLLTKRLSSAEDRHEVKEAKPVFSVDLFKKELLRSDERTLTTLHLMECTSPGSSWSFRPSLQKHASPEVRAKASCIDEELRGIASLVPHAPLSSDEVRLLARSQDPNDRMQAAAQISYFQMTECADLLGALLKDKEVRLPEILLAAELIQENKTSREWLLASVLEHFKTDAEVCKGLIHSEYMLVPLLKTAFKYFDEGATKQWLSFLCKAYGQQPQTVLLLMRGLSAMEELQAQTFLESKLQDHDIEIRNRALRGLRDTGFHTQTKDTFFQFKQLVFSETATATWLLAAMHDLEGKAACTELVLALEEQYKEITENLFCLLAIMYDQGAVNKIRENLASGVGAKEALAVEMADVLLDEELKDIMFPVIDVLPNPEKLRKLQLHSLQEQLNITSRLKNIIYYDYTKISRYIKALAIETLVQMSGSLPDEVIAHIYGKDFMLKELAFAALRLKHPDRYQMYIDKESPKDFKDFDKLTGQHPSILKKMKWLYQVPVFSRLSPHILLKLAKLSSICAIDEKGSVIIEEVEKERSISIVVKSDLQLANDKPEGSTQQYQPGDILGLIDQNAISRQAFLQSNPDLDILCIKSREFFLLVSVYDDLASALLQEFVVNPPKRIAMQSDL